RPYLLTKIANDESLGSKFADGIKSIFFNNERDAFKVYDFNEVYIDPKGPGGTSTRPKTGVALSQALSGYIAPEIRFISRHSFRWRLDDVMHQVELASQQKVRTPGDIAAEELAKKTEQSNAAR